MVHPVLPNQGKKLNQREPTLALEEAVGLAEAIHLTIDAAHIFRPSKVRPSTLIGGGQVENLAADAKAHNTDVIIVNHALSPLQQRNLERETSCKVIDRTALILEIFGERAQTREGQLQVELAALEYQKSRLVKSWTHLERQRGGLGFIGGPGESQIELDRRMIRDRITLIKKQLEKVERTRGLHRKKRDAVPYPTVALAGYTNAGKSTLFNRLTGAKVMAEDQLFATLDPTIRRIRLPSGITPLLSDTVGFISDLPTELIAAFRATLEEVTHADIILHVRDIASRDSDAQKADVEAVLKDVFGEQPLPPVIEVWNKIDLLEEPLEMLEEEPFREAVEACHPEPQAKDLSSRTQGDSSVTSFPQNDEISPIPVSAITSEGIDTLRAAIDQRVTDVCFEEMSLRIPPSDQKRVSWLYSHAHVLDHDALDNGMQVLRVRMSKALAHEFTQTSTPNEKEEDESNVIPWKEE